MSERRYKYTSCLLASQPLIEIKSRFVFVFPAPVQFMEDGVDDAINTGHVDEAAMGRVLRTSTKQRSMTFQRCTPLPTMAEGRKNDSSSSRSRFQRRCHGVVVPPPARPETTETRFPPGPRAPLGGRLALPASLRRSFTCARALQSAHLVPPSSTHQLPGICPSFSGSAGRSRPSVTMSSRFFALRPRRYRSSSKPPHSA